MLGIDLNKPIDYLHSSLRIFKEGEHHISRVCGEDVLLLVYDGVLRFTEDGVPYELHPGCYHIQRKNSIQEGHLPSDAPKYFYVHFSAEWGDGDAVLPQDGVFEYGRLKTLIEELDGLSHRGSPYITLAGKFYELLSNLYQSGPTDSIANRIADYIAKECFHPISLEMICEEFYFSKNHIINIFKKEFGMTPITYINGIKLQKAEYLMEVTSDSLESIALQCGFQNYSHFYKLFYRKHKQSPDRWRVRRQSG